jgi:hypothetical protein
MGNLMGRVRPHTPVLLLLAAFSRHEEAIDWAAQRASAAFGPVDLQSETFEFAETDYYEATMGSPLRKRFLAFERLIDPAQLVDIKLQTNQWEEDYARVEASVARPESAKGVLNSGNTPFAALRDVPPVPRLINLDPGYLELGKLVLASTKDHAHRVYLGRGIYGEVTLQYRRDVGWQAAAWTFPDYRRADYHAFFDRCREYLHQRLNE